MWKNNTYMKLFSILIANWWSLWKRVDEETDEYDNCSLLNLGQINSKVNDGQWKQVNEANESLKFIWNSSLFCLSISETCGKE